ncbi:DUF3492 domain-containing protein [Streptomyces thermoviolaceus]|uniref:D-inositol 3-phosphate glycosyltransferase n=1 Tax=Streptomyces thermoviolaceus subsp. thermoviolaceus TaxID=66860 RepID=A0ABX0YT04_STRTL|nr:DUF3492 domain-containing protein [Streptomyces thermoviolaceus]NJP15157.1 DUF3492 domain-containing protein [Streptomyces thermoviolaceus subsp. thermoviolaceus]GGV75408.1 transferase [Streptomyces thermoviolaceus subsp. apingens]GHB01943.1 transferase [Streptomyces thermoviolaceus subsp. thermoviolaceus]
MRIGLVTDGGYPYAGGDAGLWCERLVRGLGQHEFDLYALSRSRQQEDEGWLPLPDQVARVRTAPLWTADDDGARYGRRARRRFTEHYGELAAALSGADRPDRPADQEPHPDRTAGPDASGTDGQADRFATALYGLADLARDQGGGLAAALRSEDAVRTLERACRAPGALPAARTARVPDLLAVAAHLERALRPLALDWHEADGLGAADLTHATAGGAAALPGLLAHRSCGVPLLVTEYAVPLRTHYLATSTDGTAPAVRALIGAFHRALAREIYRQAAVVTHGNAHTRRWQERCGADRARLRTVHPGLDAAPFAEAGEAPQTADPDTLVWVGRVEPAKDLVSLLHAFAEVHRERPRARLRIIGTGHGPDAAAYLSHCRALAAQLFPDEADSPHTAGDNPVSFEEIGGPEAPTLAEAYAAGAVVVLSSAVEGFPLGLVEAMLCGCATVSTDVGAVVEVIGGTGLIVPPRNPRALAEACTTLLRDPERRARLGAAARARALELFTVEQNIAAFHGLYLDIVAHSPIRRGRLDEAGAPLPFAAPAEARVPGHWTDADARPVGAPAARSGPAWARRSSPARVPAPAPGTEAAR